MLNIIKDRNPVKLKDYRIEFTYKDDPTAGFVFPATSYGDPDFNRMSQEMRANYEACLSNPELVGGEVVTHEWTYVEPALGICSCGKELVLDCDHQGAVRCECGKWYNLFGQELKDPMYWED